MKGRQTLRFCLLLSLGLVFLLPLGVTLAGSFMGAEELGMVYGPALESIVNSADPGASLRLWPKVPTGENYVAAVSDSLLRRQYVNSILYSLAITVFQLMVASMAAYAITRLGERINAGLAVYAALMLLPSQVTMVPNFLVARWLGILDTPWALILPGIFAPLPVYLLTRAMGRVPKALGEAASIDGAGDWIIFTRIYLPECAPTLVASGLLGFLDAWNMVEQPLALMQDRTFHPLGVALAAGNAGTLGQIFAAAVLYTLPPLGLFLLILMLEKQGKNEYN